MAYIPKNKIKSNLYSNGEYAFIDPSQAGQIGDAYFGEYYTLATGEAFTGEYPGSGKNIPIRKRAPEGPQPDLTPHWNGVLVLISKILYLIYQVEIIPPFYFNININKNHHQMIHHFYLMSSLLVAYC